MAQKRDTYLYYLKQVNKIVYIGITNDPDRRKDEHKLDHKKFTKMEVKPIPMTEDGARKKEAEKLATYIKNHGKLPEYNK